MSIFRWGIAILSILYSLMIGMVLVMTIAEQAGTVSYAEMGTSQAQIDLAHSISAMELTGWGLIVVTYMAGAIQLIRRQANALWFLAAGTVLNAACLVAALNNPVYHRAFDTMAKASDWVMLGLSIAFVGVTFIMKQSGELSGAKPG